MAEQPSIWIFLAIAAALALGALAVAQVVESGGIVVALLGSLAWCSIAQRLWGRKIHG